MKGCNSYIQGMNWIVKKTGSYSDMCYTEKGNIMRRRKNWRAKLQENKDVLKVVTIMAGTRRPLARVC